MGEQSGSWSLEDLLEGGDISRTLSGRSAEHSGRTVTHDAQSVRANEGSSSEFQHLGTRDGPIGRTVGGGLEVGIGPEQGVPVLLNGSGYLPGPGSYGFGHDARNGEHHPGHINSHKTGADVSNHEEGIEMPPDKVVKAYTEKQRLPKSDALLSAPAANGTAKEWERVHGPQPSSGLAATLGRQAARQLILLALLLRDVIMGLMGASAHLWGLLRQRKKRSFRAWVVFVLRTVREGALETVQSLGACANNFGAYSHRRVKVWAEVYGKQLPQPVQEAARQIVGQGSLAIRRCEKALDGVYDWGQGQLAGKRNRTPKPRHKSGGGAFTVLMAFLVSLLTLRLSWNLLALSGGALRPAVPAPPDPFDVVYILQQLEQETAASMGWGPGEEEETRKEEVERVSIHDLMVLKELNERKERLAITRAAEEREKAARVAEEQGVAAADSKRKGVGGSGMGSQVGVGKTAGGKKGRYFGWLDKGGEEVIWEAPAFSEQTHLRLRHGNAIPRMGFGTAGLGNQTKQAVLWAIEAGYRLFDSATAREWYRQDELGAAIKESGIPRDHLFLVTKIHPRDMTIQGTKAALAGALKDLQTDYVDLALLHYPRCFEQLEGCYKNGKVVPGSWMDGWTALENLYWEGKVRALGVSNFDMREAGAVCRFASNKIQPHVFQANSDLITSNARIRRWAIYKRMLFMGYSTLGNQWVSQGYEPNPVLFNPVVERIAKLRNCTAAQVALRWALNWDQVIIPRSHTREHIFENFRVFQGECEVDGAEMHALNALEKMGVDRVMETYEATHQS
ncbi:Aldo/keto reductase family protein [Klebsormidium nitens]|uniref:Aldo/keto reductase family protein n=1 Tax=Klebsormidium nitens TaxID=105231 RepID=A0A1Y1HZ55_KLENI|nr:Aldo/keto reductase family protein [Klebsormidium nitens]|eukprot:GAQ83473.1 Aldo/keto reductase family protein [Klebsormidium nitens]